METQRRSPRRLPRVEGLEDRRLLTSSSSYYSYLAYNARHEYDHFVTEVQGIELQSQATPAEYLALRDDSRAITEAASTSTLPAKAGNSKALAVSIELDRAPLYGSLSDQGWAEEKTHLEASLAGLNVPQPLIDRTIADMQAVAASAGVTSDQYQTFTADLTRAREDRLRVPAGYGGIPDPLLFYTQHLRGFFRGWAVQRTAVEGKLSADLTSISASANASTADLAALNRDVQILQTLAAPVPSAINHQIHDDFVEAFAQGSPSVSEQSKLRSELDTLLGPSATRSRLAAVDRLIADAPAFFRAVGSSPANVRTIADDVEAVVDDGAGASLDPFKVTFRSAATGKNGG